MSALNLIILTCNVNTIKQTRKINMQCISVSHGFI